MHTLQSIVTGGGHRGITQVLEPLVRAGHRPFVTIVDPVPGRAATLLERLALRGRAIEAEAETVLEDIAPTALVVAGTDRMATNERLWRHAGARQVTALQQVVRTVSSNDRLPGAVTALTALQSPERPDPVMTEIFADLASVPRRSSIAFADDQASEAELVPARRQIGRATAERLVTPARALEAPTPHALAYADEILSLVAVRGEIGIGTRELGADLAADRRLPNLAVLVRSAEGIDLVIVRRGLTRVRFPLFRLPAAPTRPVPTDPGIRETGATDTLLTD